MSLRARLLIAASLTLALFVLLCAVSLNRAFERSALQGQQERMQALAYALLGGAEPNQYGDLTLSSARLPDARLERPQSGLEAALFSDNASLIWGSVSLTDSLPTPPPQALGTWRFEQLSDRFVILFGLRFAADNAAPRHYTLMLSEDSSSYHSQLSAYRRTLLLSLFLATAALLLLQVLVLRWSLRPLGRMVNELHAVERGERAEILGQYPAELRPLTQGVNAMISAERNRQTRYRNALGDLAHTLKTPLAVLRGVAERPQAPDAPRLLGEQVGRMQRIVDHQLQRAARGGGRTLAGPVALLPLAEKITAALAKVYQSRHPRFELAVPASLRLRADSSDLYELLGNLLDNAAKYGAGRVKLSALREGGSTLLNFEDDGPGFPADAGALLERGARADQREEGQGLGLAAVKDLVETYEGSLHLERSATLGGASVRVRLPT